MNHGIIGKPRNGKGLFTMQIIIDELVNSDRRFLTNFAIEKMPWVTADHQPRRGLLDYLREKHGKTFNAEERIFRVTDDAIDKFYLYRGLSREQVKEMGASHLTGYRQITPVDGVLVDSEWQFHKDIQLYLADHQAHQDKRGRDVVDSYDTRLASLSRGSVNIIDEAWKFWPARGWSNTSDACGFHFSQVGKFTDDNYIVTHRINDVDSILVDKCQDFFVCTNHGKLNFGMFRQPQVFSVGIYATKPTPSAEPQSRKVFRLDKRGLAECYDTSAGVGVSGRVMADIGHKAKGLPVWLIPVVGIALIVGAIYGVKFGSQYLRGLLAGSKKPAATIQPAKKIVSAAKVPDGLASDFQNLPVPTGDETNEVVCVGWCLLPGDAQVFLSDGRVASGRDNEVQYVRKHEVSVFGQRFRVVPRPAYTSVVDAPPRELDLNSPLIVSPPRPVNQAIILPAIHGVSPGPSPRVNGIANMTGAGGSRNSPSMNTGNY